ncbi:MAG: hypothetical protein IT311_11000 [Anaerolineales bacterium]|nr:hypothetical protein [Anaerolineales bacterium]
MLKLKKLFARLSGFSEKGQAIIIVVFALVGLISFAALAIDGGRAYIERNKVQSAADAAALSGALARVELKDWREYALASALANGYDNNGTTNIVELNTPPISGPNTNDSEYIQVIITSKISTFFGVVIGVPEITVSSQAVSQTKPAEFGPMFDGYAIVSLAPTSKCEDENKRSFWITGEATISLTGGGVFVNSNNPECAFIQQGSGSVRIVDDSPFSIVGGTRIQKPKLLTPYPPQTGAFPITYPPPFKMPHVGCGSAEAEVSGGYIGPDGKLTGATLSHGAWGEDFPPPGVTYLEPGVYCIDGDIIMEEGALYGSGVVLYVRDGSVEFSGNVEVQLSAPKSGTFAGLLLYMPISNKHVLNLNANPNSDFSGTILAPGAALHLNGLNSKAGYHSQIIAYTIKVDGQDNIQITYRDDQNFDTFKMPEVLLSD